MEAVLEEGKFAEPSVRRRDDEAVARTAEGCLSQELPKNRLQGQMVAPISRQPNGVILERAPRSSERRIRVGRKDLWAPIDIELLQLSGRSASAETEGDQAAGRCSGDELEKIADRLACA